MIVKAFSITSPYSSFRFVLGNIMFYIINSCNKKQAVAKKKLT